MKIIVCVKQVLDTAAKISIRDGQVDAAGSPRVMNPYDEFAVEEAVRIRENQGDTEVTVLTLGPEGFQDVLRTGLAMGADHAVHLLDPAFEGLDHLGLAQALARAIGTRDYDLILCGRQAVDDDMAQVGPAIAVLLGIPYISVITRLAFSDDRRRAEVTRQIEGGSEVLEAPLPLLLTCQKGLNEPRLPSLKGIMKAKKKEIQKLDAAAIGFDPETQGAAANRVRQVDLALPPKRKKGQLLEGPPEETAARLARILREEEKVL
ncbi:MAG: electron transfer flavoprotein subunit beta/FixA family protein [Nitrospinaceae bacterium]|nr:electron transfer flavoprotein subunit beta/FixA family protein [Nitrospinaceae bacterium]NIU99147.1 electron transfer flavoprotein beta subunit/FixA family protein [Nitrospinaceae bacterium]